MSNQYLSRLVQQLDVFEISVVNERGKVSTSYDPIINNENDKKDYIYGYLKHPSGGMTKQEFKRQDWLTWRKSSAIRK
ncbi:MAG: hypothetical protein IBX70_13250 [Clostridia bacterium]|nr:hypothetical protein [Clostridia bacterium]